VPSSSRPIEDRVRPPLSATVMVAAALVGPAGLVVLLRGSRFDVLFESVTFHLFVVSGISAFTLVIALVAARQAVGARRANLQPLALGAIGVTVFMLAHGLVTPGIFDRPANMWVARFPVLAITAFAVGIALVHRQPTTRIDRGTARRRLAMGVVAMVVPAAVVVADPTRLGGAGPFSGESLVVQVIAIAGGVSLVWTGLAHFRRWRLSGSRMQLSLTLAAWLGTAALVSLELGAMWRLSWWDYHAFLLAGFGAAVLAIATARRETAAVDDVLEQAFHTDPFHHITAGYPEALRTLIAAVEAKDPYTFGHSERVAELATRLGLQLGLPADRLRGLARGAYLHDVGKIGIPDRILNKPGQLDDAERAWIEEHPNAGAAMVAGSPSLTETIDVIRHHHERVDGTGYPAGLAGSAIPFSARVCAVADVWDALTSDRAYRDAMSKQQALGHILAGRGTHFDPVVVDALVTHLGAEAIVPTEQGDERVAVEAAHACHRVDPGWSLEPSALSGMTDSAEPSDPPAHVGD